MSRVPRFNPKLPLPLNQHIFEAPPACQPSCATRPCDLPGAERQVQGGALGQCGRGIWEFGKGRLSVGARDFLRLPSGSMVPTVFRSPSFNHGKLVPSESRILLGGFFDQRDFPPGGNSLS